MECIFIKTEKKENEFITKDSSYNVYVIYISTAIKKSGKTTRFEQNLVSRRARICSYSILF